MSVWQVQICKTTLWNCTCTVYVSEKIKKLLKDFPDVFDIAEDILVAGYNEDCTDHGTTLLKVLQKFIKEHSILNNNKCNFRCMCSILW